MWRNVFDLPAAPKRTIHRASECNWLRRKSVTAETTAPVYGETRIKTDTRISRSRTDGANGLHGDRAIVLAAEDRNTGYLFFFLFSFFLFSLSYRPVTDPVGETMRIAPLRRRFVAANQTVQRASMQVERGRV